ncbi:DNA-binding transcriptional regulator, MocR family, contains an aminotransferase domain [Pedobacter hartonius]|uniref:DNA-binding transcriptional regulator, MocR family, contains an aminotransferase domain n=2 Tax=Pedobacter hartonius TaxID=425514 RepID=A0A1H3WCB5_9SPHI|nr:DNA-binding transcriptional regulator, MocR family, contains an aminotransferase domain [Pedobacter hartonius]
MKELNGENKKTAGFIASVIARLVIKDPSLLGVKLPIQKDLKESLNVAMAVIQGAWSILLKGYQIIHTQTGVGTFVVPELSEDQRNRIEKMIKQSQVSEKGMMLDRETIYGFKAAFNAKVNRALLLYVDLPSKKKDLKIVPDLLAELAKLVSTRMNYVFNEDEVYYADDHLELVTFSFEAFSDSKNTVVMMNPFSDAIRKAAVKAKRKLRVIGIDDSTGLIAQLKEVCSDCKVDLVYIGSTIPYPLMIERSRYTWDGLLELQKKYQFKILLDNRFPGVLKYPSLLEGILPGTNSSVIIIMKPTIHPTFSTINVIAGHKSDISKVKKKYHRRAVQVHPIFTYALLHLMRMEELNKHELEAYAAISTMVVAAKEVLLEKGVFIKEYIEKQQAWFFYLQLNSGRFARNVYSKHSKSNLYTMDPDSHLSDPHFSEGILISIAGYSIMARMVRDLRKLIENII